MRAYVQWTWAEVQWLRRMTVLMHSKQSMLMKTREPGHNSKACALKSCLTNTPKHARHNTHTHTQNTNTNAYRMWKWHTIEKAESVREWEKKRCQWVRIIRAGSACVFEFSKKKERKCSNKELVGCNQRVVRTKDASLLSVLPFDLSNKYVLQQHRQSYNFLFSIMYAQTLFITLLFVLVISLLGHKNDDDEEDEGRTESEKERETQIHKHEHTESQIQSRFVVCKIPNLKIGI